MSQPHDLFLETANHIGIRLCRDAVWAGTRCNWLGAAMEFTGNAWTVVHRAFGPDLYSGTSGIALFLGRLYAITPERLYRTTAEGGLQLAVERLEEISSTSRGAFYSGLTGIAFALISLGEIFDSESLIAKALEILAQAAQDDLSQHELDVISGSAGAIPALLYIYHRQRQDFILELAIKHGEHLLNAAHKTEIGWSWNTLNVAGQPDLTGFSHGAAGIAWALLELFQVTGQEKFRVAAERGFQYERHWFSSEQENWRDLRSFDALAPGAPANTEAPVYSLGWCHGAPGIGLSRLRAYEVLQQEIYRQELEAAVRTTVKMLNHSVYSGYGNYSLCHGMAGNADLLVSARRVLEKDGYESVAEQVGWQGIERYQKLNAPWPCGILGGGEAPNLMLGLAGIGYFYLRLYDPMKTPSVMLIEPDPA